MLASSPALPAAPVTPSFVSPALSRIAPEPAAEIVPVVTEMSSPANSRTPPLPPAAVMLAATVRSAPITVPSAASVIAPPSLLTTACFTVSDPVVVSRISSAPLLSFAVSLIVRPFSPLTVPTSRLPTLSSAMSPESVTAAMRESAVSMSLATTAASAIPVPARNAAANAVMFAASPAELSVIAPPRAVIRISPAPTLARMSAIDALPVPSTSMRTALLVVFPV